MPKDSVQRIQVLEHAAFWLFIFLFIFDYHFIANNWGEATGATFKEVATYCAIVYLNLLVLVPVFLEKKQNFPYVLSLFSVVTGYVFLMQKTGLESQFYELGGWRNVFSMVLNTSLFLLISSLYWYFKRGQQQREQFLKLKNEKNEVEINFLRSQINPHFIFNTLNNIYALALQKNDNTAPMVAKLSALLRHVLYEGSQGQVLLSKELEILTEFIELHLLRKPRSQNIDFYMEGNPNGWQIAPMMLLSLVENTFKHSNLDQDEKAWIKIHSDVGEDGKFIFLTENNDGHLLSDKEHGGIGLQNVYRQLELNYPNDHSFIQSTEGGVFVSQLTLQLKKR